MTAFWKLLKQQFDHYLSGNSIGKTNKLCSPLKYTQGCALAELSGPWRLTFVLGRLENLSFSKEIIRRAHWISQVQSTGLLSVFLEHNLDIDPVDSGCVIHLSDNWGLLLNFCWSHTSLGITNVREGSIGYKEETEWGAFCTSKKTCLPSRPQWQIDDGYQEASSFRRRVLHQQWRNRCREWWRNRIC